MAMYGIFGVTPPRGALTPTQGQRSVVVGRWKTAKSSESLNPTTPDKSLSKGVVPWVPFLKGSKINAPAGATMTGGTTVTAAKKALVDRSANGTLIIPKKTGDVKSSAQTPVRRPASTAAIEDRPKWNRGKSAKDGSINNLYFMRRSASSAADSTEPRVTQSKSGKHESFNNFDSVRRPLSSAAIQQRPRWNKPLRNESKKVKKITKSVVSPNTNVICNAHLKKEKEAITDIKLVPEDGDIASVSSLEPIEAQKDDKADSTDEVSKEIDDVLHQEKAGENEPIKIENKKVKKRAKSIASPIRKAVFNAHPKKANEAITDIKIVPQDGDIASVSSLEPSVAPNDDNADSTDEISKEIDDVLHQEKAGKNEHIKIENKKVKKRAKSIVSPIRKTVFNAHPKKANEAITDIKIVPQDGDIASVSSLEPSVAPKDDNADSTDEISKEIDDVLHQEKAGKNEHIKIENKKVKKRAKSIVSPIRKAVFNAHPKKENEAITDIVSQDGDIASDSSLDPKEAQKDDKTDSTDEVSQENDVPLKETTEKNKSIKKESKKMKKRAKSIVSPNKMVICNDHLKKVIEATCDSKIVQQDGDMASAHSVEPKEAPMDEKVDSTDEESKEIDVPHQERAEEIDVPPQETPEEIDVPHQERAEEIDVPHQETPEEIDVPHQETAEEIDVPHQETAEETETRLPTEEKDSSSNASTGDKIAKHDGKVDSDKSLKSKKTHRADKVDSVDLEFKEVDLARQHSKAVMLKVFNGNSQQSTRPVSAAQERNRLAIEKKIKQMAVKMPIKPLERPLKRASSQTAVLCKPHSSAVNNQEKSTKGIQAKRSGSGQNISKDFPQNPKRLLSVDKHHKLEHKLTDLKCEQKKAQSFCKILSNTSHVKPTDAAVDLSDYGDVKSPKANMDRRADHTPGKAEDVELPNRKEKKSSDTVRYKNEDQTPGKANEACGSIHLDAVTSHEYANKTSANIFPDSKPFSDINSEERSEIVQMKSTDTITATVAAVTPRKIVPKKHHDAQSKQLSDTSIIKHASSSPRKIVGRGAKTVIGTGINKPSDVKAKQLSETSIEKAVNRVPKKIGYSGHKKTTQFQTKQQPGICQKKVSNVALLKTGYSKPAAVKPKFPVPHPHKMSKNDVVKAKDHIRTASESTRKCSTTQSEVTDAIGEQLGNVGSELSRGKVPKQPATSKPDACPDLKTVIVEDKTSAPNSEFSDGDQKLRAARGQHNLSTQVNDDFSQTNVQPISRDTGSGLIPTGGRHPSTLESTDSSVDGPVKSTSLTTQPSSSSKPDRVASLPNNQVLSSGRLSQEDDDDLVETEEDDASKDTTLGINLQHIVYYYFFSFVLFVCMRLFEGEFTYDAQQ